MLAKEIKPKKCKAPGCGNRFTPRTTTQKACSIACAVAMSKDSRVQNVAAKAITRQAREELKERREKLKTRREHMAEAQTAFNAYIRERDAGLPCISCDSLPSDHDLITGSRWDAGHYRSVGACPELRFEPLNVHRQCVKCNRNLSGNAVEYRIRLVRRIGADQVEWLEGPHKALRLTIEDLQAIKALYRQKLKDLRRAAA
ncbi:MULTISPECIES: recombination protein NinG [Pseudomonas]|uniref:recombination protein NinG n=1 Tax=Pseudomonas TaxID=286 RepID=UPI0002A166B0|nr:MULTISPECIES: recombination protein NinG [Pseudomonas]AGA72634.1 bacteriophage lambda NinG family protein [Pseudomonas putida HB3267]MCE0757200.1 recombination protein NinG [Pseudomonas asiatica]MCE0946448.1 recombination protein NinG [Pseudomonas asiatica]MCE0956011.1 recombination protein NinG [Pseudomonas asiatica]MCE1031056.1 recombination protein NinG [Pseudomonas asiatica]